MANEYTMRQALDGWKAAINAGDQKSIDALKDFNARFRTKPSPAEAVQFLKGEGYFGRDIAISDLPQATQQVVTPPAPAGDPSLLSRAGKAWDFAQRPLSETVLGPGATAGGVVRTVEGKRKSGYEQRQRQHPEDVGSKVERFLEPGHEAIAGAAEGSADYLDALQSPIGLATAAAGPYLSKLGTAGKFLGRTAATLFTGEQLEGLYRDVVQTMKDPTPESIARMITQIGAAGASAAMLKASKGWRGEKAAEPAKAGAVPEPPPPAKAAEPAAPETPVPKPVRKTAAPRVAPKVPEIVPPKPAGTTEGTVPAEPAKPGRFATKKTATPKKPPAAPAEEYTEEAARQIADLESKKAAITRRAKKNPGGTISKYYQRMTDDLDRKIEEVKQSGRQGATVQPELHSARLPQELAGAKPKYNYGEKSFDLNFTSDIEKAAYISAQPKLSKRDAEYVEFVRKNTGLRQAEVRAYGAEVRDAVKELAKNAEPGTLHVPLVRPASATGRANMAGIPQPPVPAMR